MRDLKRIVCSFFCVLLTLMVSSASAAETPITEKILDILKSNGQINQQQYDDLLSQAKEEAKAQPAAKHHGKGVPLEMSWDKGLRFNDPDGKFKFKFGGRIMNDWAWFDADSDINNAKGGFTDGTEFRRARLYLAGTVYGRIGFKAQYDFAGGDADFKDLYMELKKVPYVGHIRVGHFKEAYSLEELTSSKYITFMERSIANVAPSRNTGLAMYNTIGKAKRGTWAVGAFREADGYGDAKKDGDAYNVTGRITGLPWYEEKGAKLLHVGLSYSHKFGDASSLHLRQKPEAHLGRYLIDTGTVLFDDVDLVTPEVALVVGPFSLQSEYTRTSVSRAGGNPDLDFDSYYVEGSYFLTGEHRKYSTSHGAFSRVSPKANFGDGGYGAWQFAARYSNANYNDADINGGELRNVTVGLNWYLNPNMRVMLNYINSDLDKVGSVDIGQMRFQIDF